MPYFEHSFKNFHWIDLDTPQQDQFIKLSNEWDIPLHSLSDCLNPEHLPKFEHFQGGHFIIFRFPDVSAKKIDHSIQEVTKKLIVFIKEDVVVTIHRGSITFLDDKSNRCRFEDYPNTQELLGYFCEEMLKTFDQPIVDIEHQAEALEQRVYALKKNKILRDGYLIRRKSSAYKKVLKLTVDIFSRMTQYQQLVWIEFQDTRSYLDRLLFYAEDVNEDINGLMNLHISLISQKTNEASFRTNEVMRVLTIFSIFFLPLNFIAGVYGMNFENMPELHHPHGYYWILTAMCVVSFTILFWIMRKGWIGSPKEPSALDD